MACGSRFVGDDGLARRIGLKAAPGGDGRSVVDMVGAMERRIAAAGSEALIVLTALTVVTAKRCIGRIDGLLRWRPGVELNTTGRMGWPCGHDPSVTETVALQPLQYKFGK